MLNRSESAEDSTLSKQHWSIQMTSRLVNLPRFIYLFTLPSGHKALQRGGGTFSTTLMTDLTLAMGEGGNEEVGEKTIPRREGSKPKPRHASFAKNVVPLPKVSKIYGLPSKFNSHLQCPVPKQEARLGLSRDVLCPARC